VREATARPTPQHHHSVLCISLCRPHPGISVAISSSQFLWRHRYMSPSTGLCLTSVITVPPKHSSFLFPDSFPSTKDEKGPIEKLAKPSLRETLFQSARFLAEPGTA
jgi:hypothetical protein